MKRIAAFAVPVFFALVLGAVSLAARADVSHGRDFATVELVAPKAPAPAPAGDVGRSVKINGARQNADGSFKSIEAGGVFHVECVNAKGEVEWSFDVHNAIANDGANYLRDAFFKANAVALIANAPVVGLLTATPTVTTTLATMTEATGGGYARKSVTWAASTTGSANNTASAASWTATATPINAVTYLFITDATTGTVGKFLAFAALTGGPYTVNVGSTLNVTYTWTVA